jgi:hypothetical protein
MLDPSLKPPTVGVPGPYRAPQKQDATMVGVRQPGWRLVTAPQDTTVGEMAERMYGTRSEWNRVFNDNRAGKELPDGSTGYLSNPNQIIQQGQAIWLSA